MRIAVVTPPSTPAVSWEEADAHLRLDGDTDQQEFVERLIEAATAHIDGPDGWLGRAIREQELDAFLPSFGCVGIGLPYPPVIEITGIDYVDANGATVTLATDDYELRGKVLHPSWPNSWPSAHWRGCDGEPVRIRYRAGYETVPEPIKAAILLMVGDMWAARASVATGPTMNEVPMSMTVQNLLAPYRMWS